MSNDYHVKSSCRLCGKKDLISVLSLNPTPPGNHFVNKEQLNDPQRSYPLELMFCENCHHIQLAHVVDPTILYRQNYSYVSSTSQVFIDHLRNYADNIIEKYSIPANSLVIDIGSNDGTALSFFKKKNYQTLGIDPATNIVELANDKGIETLCEFFSLAVAEKYQEKYGKAQLINSHNVCAHIDDLTSVIEGVRCWLDDGGLFVFEVGYFADVYHNAWFDTIYHEHLDYHTAAPLVSFFEKFGMQVISIERVDSQGGSLRMAVQKNTGKRIVEPSVQQMIDYEQKCGLDCSETIIAFSNKIQTIKKQLSTLIQELKANGFSIAGYGAPTKATTLLAYFELAKYLDFIVDDNSFKQNLFTPGSHIPVYSPAALIQKKPDYTLILSWNFADDIIERQKDYLEAGGEFILPMPKPCIVNANLTRVTS